MWSKVASRTVVATLLLGALVPSVAAGAAGQPERAAICRGVVFLASELGGSVSVEEVRDVARACRLNLVVFDFAWITYHWPRTRMGLLARVCDALAKEQIEVAVMYRPRVLGPAEAHVHLARDARGAVANSHNDLCLAHEDSRQWACAWGSRMLARLPRVDQVILYNVRPSCECEACRGGKAIGHVGELLRRCRSEWSGVRPAVRIGHVGVGEEYAESVELLYPFVAVNQTEDHKPIPFPADQLRRLRAAYPGKFKAPLLKVDWATETRGTTGDLVRTLRDSAAADTGFLLWHYDCVFHADDGRFDRRAIVEALGGRWDAVSGYYTPPHTVAPTKGDPQDAARVLKRFQADPLHMHHEVAALGEGVVDGLVRILEDQKLGSVQRFRAALILGDIRSKRALKPLRKALQDPEYNVRRCAALALGRMGDVASRPALEKLAKDDPVAWKHPDTGKVEYLVREYAAQALDMLSGRTPTPAPAPQKQQEMFLEDASRLPPAPDRWQRALLPWPFPGGFREQNIWNNYTQALDFYIHGGLDFLQQPGAEVRAVAEGYVAAIATNYPQWKTHHFFIVTSRKDGNEGWCYTHVDPDSYTFKPGDRIRQGQVLGKLVDFYVGKNKGVDHLHLNYVRFQRTAPDKVVAEPLFDPLLAFDWRDTVAPQIHAPLRFVKKDTLAEFPADQEGVPRVSGRVEIIAGFSDAGCAERPSVWMVSVITLEITGERARPWRRLVLDQRGPIAHVGAAGALYLTSTEAKRWTVSPYPRVFFAKVTSTDGDGAVEPADRAQAWDTTETDAQGQPRFPDGTYTVTVRAWDLQGNPAMRTAAVRVANHAAP